MSSRNKPWSDLPLELTETIGNRLNDNPIHVLHFRSVCTSWRKSIPPFSRPRLRLPLTGDPHDIGFFSLAVSTLYHLQPRKPFLNPSPADTFFVIHQQKRKHYNRFPNHESFPKTINLSDFRVTEIRRFYRTDYYRRIRSSSFQKDPIRNFHKVVLLSTARGGYAMAAVYYGGRLGLLKPNGVWIESIKEKGIGAFFDAIAYKGKFYALGYPVDRCIVRVPSCIVMDDSLSSVSQITFPKVSSHDKTSLVESSGDLLLVLVHLSNVEKVLVTVYKLDEDVEGKYKWVEMNTLGDRALFVNNYCSFSVSAPEYLGFKRNCIYYKGYIKNGEDGCVFDLKNGIVKYQLSFFNEISSFIRYHW